MLRRQPAIIGFAGMIVLALVVLGWVWPENDGRAPGEQEPLGSTTIDQIRAVTRIQPCVPCHGPEFEFAGSMSELDVHGSVYEGLDAGQSGGRKPP